MKKTNLLITGMHCASCASLISRGLSKAEGVKEANVNYSTAKGFVVYDESLTSPEKLIGVVKQRGYGAVVSEGGHSGHQHEEMEKKEYEKLKGKFILSLFFAVPAFIIGM